MPRTKGTRRTRKAGRGALSVEALHSSFERMDTRIRAAVESGVTDRDLGRAVERAWGAAFQKELSAPAIQGLVSHYRGLYGGSRKGRRTRRQRGGMAPLDWTMGQGNTATVFGRFPMDFSTSQQAIKSLDLNLFQENSVSRSCDSTGGRDTLASQKGGGIFSTLLAGHAPASVPRNLMEGSVSAVQGRAIADPIADPVRPAWQPAASVLTPFDTSAVSNLSGLAPVYTAY
jgi:hypothetical protein